MERMYAFTDEYGAFGYDLDNPSVSTHFIITAIIVRESDLEAYTAGAEAIRKKYFQTGEIKSSKLGPEKHHRRMLILQDISALPMHFLTICIDKRSCMENMNARLRLHELSDIMTPSQRRGCHHGEITASA